MLMGGVSMSSLCVFDKLTVFDVWQFKSGGDNLKLDGHCWDKINKTNLVYYVLNLKNIQQQNMAYLHECDILLVEREAK